MSSGWKSVNVPWIHLRTVGPMLSSGMVMPLLHHALSESQNWSVFILPGNMNSVIHGYILCSQTVTKFLTAESDYSITDGGEPFPPGVVMSGSNPSKWTLRQAICIRLSARWWVSSLSNGIFKVLFYCVGHLIFPRGEVWILQWFALLTP